MKHIKDYSKFLQINEDNTNEVGINYDADFTDEDKSIIEDEIYNHIADMLESGYTSGELYGEEPYYIGSYSVEIEKDDNDEETRYNEVARLIREGYASGFEPTFSWNANVYV